MSHFSAFPSPDLLYAGMFFILTVMEEFIVTFIQGWMNASSKNTENVKQLQQRQLAFQGWKK